MTDETQSSNWDRMIAAAASEFLKPAPPTRRKEKIARDRGAVAYRMAQTIRRSGATYAEMVERLRQHPDTASWVEEKGERNDQQELRHIWERAEPKGRVIRLVAGELHTTATAAETALIASDLPIFQRGDGLVRPISTEVPASHHRTTIAAALGELSPFALMDVMCATAE